LVGDFARGLERDRQAVEAALVERWSTSPVEGHINRLKTLKRAMYGRAKLDLLRQRMLLAA
jgi:transposase